MARTMILVSALVVALLGAVTGTTAQEASPVASPLAGTIDVALRDVDEQEVGRARLTEMADGAVSIKVSVEGLAPGEHGIHVHAVGLCDPAGDEPYDSAGAHYNPTDAVHGGPPAMGTPDAEGTPGAMTGHAGDLGNITVDEAGAGQLQISTDRFRLAELSDADGSALVVHADPDDVQTDPAGNSGGRLVCGVTVPSREGGTPIATPAS